MLYLVSEAAGLEPWLREYGTTTRGGETLPNVFVAYGPVEAPWLSVGTWDASWVGDRAPTQDEEVCMTRQNVGMRLVLAAAAAGDVGHEAVGELIASIAGAAWRPTTVRIDGAELSGWTLSMGKHAISYATDRGRTVVVEKAQWDPEIDLVSSSDFDVVS
jgi:hypothetical protein